MPLGKCEYKSAEQGVHKATFTGSIRDEIQKPDQWPNHKAYLYFEFPDLDDVDRGTASVDVNQDLVLWTKLLTGAEVPHASDGQVMWDMAWSELVGAEWTGLVLVNKNGYIARPTPPPQPYRWRFDIVPIRENGLAATRSMESFGNLVEKVLTRFIVAEGDYAGYWTDCWFNVPECHWSGDRLEISDKSALWKLLEVGLRADDFEKINVEPHASPIPAFEAALQAAADTGITFWATITNAGYLGWRTMSRVAQELRTRRRKWIGLRGRRRDGGKAVCPWSHYYPPSPAMSR